MSNDLYLTDEEFKVLKNYKLLNEFDTHLTVLDYQDSPEQIKERVAIMELESSELKNFKEQLIKGSSSITKIVSTLNLNKLSKNDCEEIVYALGPKLISQIIQNTIQESEKNLMPLISGLSYLRHVLFGELQHQNKEFAL